MGNIALVLGFIAGPFAWRAIVRSTRPRGWHPLISHGVGALMLLPVVLAVFGLGQDPGVPSGFFFVLVAGVLYLIVRPRRAAPLAPPPPSAAAAADACDVEPVRKQSLAAMKRATAARMKDKEARREHDAAPLAGWSPAGQPGTYIADIEFDYVDARGKASHRRVLVEAVDSEYLEGFCHTALETRTFVVGRVRGKVLDKETGELLPPKKWAAQMRIDPRNGVVSMGGDRREQ